MGDEEWLVFDGFGVQVEIGGCGDVAAVHYYACDRVGGGEGDGGGEDCALAESEEIETGRINVVSGEHVGDEFAESGHALGHGFGIGAANSEHIVPGVAGAEAVGCARADYGQAGVEGAF